MDEDWKPPEAEERARLNETLSRMLELEDKLSSEPPSADRDKMLGIIRRHSADMVRLFDEYYVWFQS